MLRTRKSLTLIEAVVAAAVLAFGIIMVSQGLLITLEGFNYVVDYLNVLLWMDNKFWEAHDKLVNYNTLMTEDEKGSFMVNNKQFNWELCYNLIEGTETASLYALTLRVSWKEGMRIAKTLRSGYALYISPEGWSS